MRVAEDLTVVIFTVGESTYKECCEKITQQSLRPKYIETIRNIAPISEACNRIFTKVQTKYYLHVDADMILSPNCIELLYDAIKKHQSCYLVKAWLRDEILGKIGWIKLFNKDLIGEIRYNYVIGCDREFEKRVKNKGYDEILIDYILGKHIATHDKRMTFFRFKRVAEKDRYFKEKHFNMIIRYISKTRNHWGYYALFGYLYGFLIRRPGVKKEKDYTCIKNDIMYKIIGKLFPDKKHKISNGIK
jgi:hypothetical protein